LQAADVGTVDALGLQFAHHPLAGGVRTRRRPQHGVPAEPGDGGGRAGGHAGGDLKRVVGQIFAGFLR